jgi:hypothetical protein
MEEQSLHPEWDLMYRKGLPFGLIAKLCKAPRSTVHLHLQRQAVRYPALNFPARSRRGREPHCLAMVPAWVPLNCRGSDFG